MLKFTRFFLEIKLLGQVVNYQLLYLNPLNRLVGQLGKQDYSLRFPFGKGQSKWNTMKSKSILI